MKLNPENYINRILQERFARMEDQCVFNGVGNYSKAYETYKRMQNIFNSVRSKLLPLGNNEAMKILDIGCGDGYHAFYMYYNLDCENIFIHGIDISETDLHLAEEFKKRFSIANDKIVFTIGDAEHLCFEPNTFDMVICTEVLEHLQNPKNCFLEMARVLKPGGTAIISTPNDDNPIITFIKRFKRVVGANNEELKEQRIRNIEIYSVSPGHISVVNLESLKKSVRESGLIIEGIKRGSIIFGGPKYNAHPILFGLILICDILLDYLPFTENFTENITLILKK